MTPTHYSVLDVPNTATFAEIRRAYHTKARLIHPDRNSNPTATAEFQKIQAAYELLNNPEERSRYDIELGLPALPQHSTHQPASTKPYDRPPQNHPANPFTYSASEEDYGAENSRPHIPTLQEYVLKANQYYMAAVSHMALCETYNTSANDFYLAAKKYSLCSHFYSQQVMYFVGLHQLNQPTTPPPDMYSCGLAEIEIGKNSYQLALHEYTQGTLMFDHSVQQQLVGANEFNNSFAIGGEVRGARGQYDYGSKMYGSAIDTCDKARDLYKAAASMFSKAGVQYQEAVMLLQAFYTFVV